MANNTFVVNSGVAIPQARRGRQKKDITGDYPFADMEIGSMFIVAGKNNVAKARNAAQQWKRDHGPQWHFTTRDLSGQPDGSGGKHEPETYGVWRVVPTKTVDDTRPGATNPSGQESDSASGD